MTETSEWVDLDVGFDLQIPCEGVCLKDRTSRCPEPAWWLLTWSCCSMRTTHCRRHVEHYEEIGENSQAISCTDCGDPDSHIKHKEKL